jgi:hypothetical protein
MKVAFKSMVAAAAFIAMGAASAAIVTVPTGGTFKNLKLTSGTQVLTLSQEVLDSLMVGPITVAPVGVGVLITNPDPADPAMLVSAAVNTPLSAIDLDDTTQVFQAAQSLGGFSLTTTTGVLSRTGGSVSISDMKVDLAAKRVYATIVGANGVGTLSNFYLFDVASVTGAASLPATAGVSTFTASGLALTADGSTKFSTALGLSSLGRAVLFGMAPNFGSVDVSVTTSVPPLTTGCTVTQTIAATGPRTFNATVTLSNQGSNTANGWAVGWTFSVPSILSSVKNAKITSNTGLTSFVAQPVASNKVIAAGASTTFSFRGTTRGGVPAVSNVSAKVNGVACPLVK